MFRNKPKKFQLRKYIPYTSTVEKKQFSIYLLIHVKNLIKYDIPKFCKIKPIFSTNNSKYNKTDVTVL